MENPRHHKDSPAKPGDVVYVMRRANGDLKIGSTGNLSSRYCNLRYYYGTSFEILATMPGYKQEERLLQEQFSEHRIYSHGGRRRTDWFLPCQKLYEWIDQNMTPYAGHPFTDGDDKTYLTSCRFSPRKVQLPCSAPSPD